jgi:hypothetical protein
MKLRLVVATIIAVMLSCASSANAHAQTPTMPIDFVGEWCFSSQENLSMNYMLPSWTEEGHCKKILSVSKHGFGFENKSYCEPLKIKLSKDTAPSGTAYIAMITARCRAATIQIDQAFKFERYKGNLTVTSK